jgi:hypothetical protein
MRNHVQSILALLICAALMLGSFTACSAAGSRSKESPATPETTAAQKARSTMKASGLADGTDQAEEGPEPSAADTASSSTAAQAAAATSKQKIIERLSYVIETLKFDESVRMVQNLCTDLGGYIQDSSITGNEIRAKNLREATFTLRVPQEKLGQLKTSVSNIGNVLNFSSSSENISDKYFDTEARLKSLRTQQERLLALLQKSGSLKDIIELEKALADVNYQIEELTGTLRQYDSLVDYSTVTIQLNEVVEPTETETIPVTLGDKISRQFMNSMKALGEFGEGLLIFIIGDSPILLILAATAAAVIFGLRKRKKSLQAKLVQMAQPQNKEEEHSDQ